MAKADTRQRLIAENRKARFDYFIEERYEAGLVLEGWEVKAMRAGHAQLTEGLRVSAQRRGFPDRRAHLPAAHHLHARHARPDAHAQAAAATYAELQQLIGAVERRGYTLVPLELYWKSGRAKLQVGLAKGKKQHDKRATEKDRDWQRDKARALRRG